MFKLDKNYHKTYNLKDSRREIDNYKDWGLEEKLKVFAYLQSVAYNFKLGSPPRMDKAVHSCR